MVAETYCLAIKPPPLEVVNKLAEVKTQESRNWVVDFSKLFKAWENKTICAKVTFIGTN